VVLPWDGLVEDNDRSALVDIESLVEGCLDDITRREPSVGEII
jgi:hypothetical protein